MKVCMPEKVIHSTVFNHEKGLQIQSQSLYCGLAFVYGESYLMVLHGTIFPMRFALCYVPFLYHFGVDLHGIMVCFMI